MNQPCPVQTILTRPTHPAIPETQPLLSKPSPRIARGGLASISASLALAEAPPRLLALGGAGPARPADGLERRRRGDDARAGDEHADERLGDDVERQRGDRVGG